MCGNVRASILSNYEVLLDTWDDPAQIVTDTESKARIKNGVAAQMKTYDFVFGDTLDEMILQHSDYAAKLPSETIVHYSQSNIVIVSTSWLYHYFSARSDPEIFT